MAKKYRVVVAGLGKRGMHHAAAFKSNPRFEVVGLCDIDQTRLNAAAQKLASVQADTDVARLAAAAQPDVFCFCTLPSVRRELIKVGVDSGAKLIAFEKPIALSSEEAMQIRDTLRSAGVKAVVSHQHRYGAHYQRVHQIIQSGALGRVHTVYGTATGWMMHMLSHLVDYMRWYNGGADAEWVMGQASGRGKLADVHASPDYIGGFIQFSNGVRGVVECGAGAPDVPEVDYWWRKCCIGAQGSDGFAEVLTGAGWRAVTKTGSWSGEGCMNYDQDMPPYVQEMADWLDCGEKVHSCNFESAFKGFEIISGLIRSAVEGGQVPLPLSSGMDELALLKQTLPDKRVLFSIDANSKEYAA